MSQSTRRVLAVLGRWPRRIAAAGCLLLAAGSALAPQPAAAPAAHGIGGRLAPGQVAVPVAVTGVVDGLLPGDRVGVLSSPADGQTGSTELVVDRLRVLSVQHEDGGEGSDALVVVVTDRPGAIRLASVTTRTLRLMIDDLP